MSRNLELFLVHFFRWLGSTRAASALNDSEWLFPMVESIHIAGLAVLIGTIAIVDFRLLGLTLRSQPVSQIARSLKPWTLAGIAIMLTTGPLMLSAEPERGYGNPAFAFKMACLALALLTHFAVHNRVTRSERSGAGGRVAACLSLALWTGVVLGGRAIAFF